MGLAQVSRSAIAGVGTPAMHCTATLIKGFAMIVLALRLVWALARLLSLFSYAAGMLAGHLLFATVRRGHHSWTPRSASRLAHRLGGRRG